MHCRYNSSCAPPIHTETLHKWGYALGCYKNWPQRWLWIVILLTPKEHEHERSLPPTPVNMTYVNQIQKMPLT